MEGFLGLTSFGIDVWDIKVLKNEAEHVVRQVLFFVMAAIPHEMYSTGGGD
jgi:hypothetical protein